MKSTQAWGWLAAGVMALGLNGIYQDMCPAWAHRAVNHVIAQAVSRSGAVVALAAGRADWFMANAQANVARNETASCRLAAAAARFQARMARAQSGVARYEAMSAREEARMAAFEANRARLEAQLSDLQFVPASFNEMKIPDICPRVNVRVPHVNVQVAPAIRIPEVHVETF